MTIEDYKGQITERIKDNINQWIDKLKLDHKDLHLTKQWKILFPKGFRPGNNEIPIVTTSKNGEYVVGELLFYLPDNLELDMDTIELTLKDEPHKAKKRNVVTPPPLDGSLDVLNNIVLGLNDFLVNLPIPTQQQPQSFRQLNPIKEQNGNTAIKVNRGFVNQDMSSLKSRILNSTYLPDWFSTVDSKEIKEQLLSKISESLAHYEQQVGRSIDLQEFFDKYTEMLKTQDKLYHYCRYKSKPITLDSHNKCTENYCSKKPFNSECSHVSYKFGYKN